MRNFYNKFGLLFICFVALFVTNGFSQIQSRLPSAEELNKKAALQKIYNSGSNLGGVTPHLLTTGPEQNCANAIPVCNNSYTQTSSYTGHGTIQEVNNTCLGTQETNSVWYVFTVQNSGAFTFMLNTANDYDFALYDITNIGCSGVPTATPIRCNFSATYGSTGLTLPVSASTNLGVSASGVPTMPGLNVNAGQTFALIIDNFSANTNGYTLTFGSGLGAAQIYDNIPPTLTTSTFACNGNSIKINFSEPVSCSSISSNGSDFTITGPSGSVPVTGVIGNLCSTGASNTNYATVTFNNTGLPSGTYTVNIAQGTDGNTVLDKCGNAMSTSQTVTFQYLAPFTVAATNTAVCAGFPTTLTINPNGIPVGQAYSWAPGGATTQSIVVSPNVAITYVATVSYGGCTRSVSQAIAISQPPVVSVNPANASLCSGTTTLVATAMSNGIPCTTCNYTWTGSSSQVDNNVASSSITGAGLGSYSVSVSSSQGCVGNTAVSNVSILSPSAPPSCDIIYVTPTGGGTGLTKASPTTIQNALTMAACNAITIKMAVGDYSITAPLNLNSFITVEGGYNTAFTLKTSSTGTTGVFPNRGTRIYRTNTVTEGAAPAERLTAIEVAAGSNNFRLQDLTIEVQNAPTSTIAKPYGISTYGVYMNSCNNYNIVRCKIIAGNAGAGLAGVDGAPGADGTSGNLVSYLPGGGGNGCNDDASVLTVDDGDGGAQTAGGGMTQVTIGFWDFACGVENTTQIVSENGTNPRMGGEGGAGGTGGYGSGASGIGSNGGNGGAGALGGTTGGTAVNDTGCGGSQPDGVNGANGQAGTDGTNGTSGLAGSIIGGYWNSGSAGTNGADGTGGGGGKGGSGGAGDPGGFLCSVAGVGAGGGAGGGGGQGGALGTGGYGGGSAYAVFLFNNGSNGNIVDCKLVNGTAGSGGAGGLGGAKGLGGSGGLGGCADACTGTGEGDGGDGGNGGNGGKGGDGGAGASGETASVKLVSGSALSVNSSLNLDNQALITAENIACSNINIDYTSASGAPINWTNFGSTANPALGTGTPFNDVQYSGLGRKTITLNSNVTSTLTTNVAAFSYTNTASSANLGTTSCPTPINNTIAVSGYSAAVTSGNISIKVTTANHTYFSDVSMFLVAPNGQILGLNNNKGNAAGCSLNNVTFSDAAAGAMPAATCPASGASYKPETTTFTDCSVTSNITTFAAIGGGSINPNGNWVLRMVDNANNDGGSGIAVNGWTLNLPAYSYTSTSSGTQTDPYTDFVNIQVTPPSTGSVLASASAICPGSANFNSTAVGTAGLTYSWTTSPSATITSVTSSSTSITFANATASAIVYTVSLNITSECCGTLTPVTNTILVNPIPAAPTATVNSICVGGVATFTANTPAGSSFAWYNAASSGSLLATGSTYSLANVNSPTTIYLQATNSGGCTSTLTPIIVTPTLIPAPTAVPAVSCDPGLVTVAINPASGVTDYNWYSDASGTVLVQSGNSLNYSQNIATSGGSYVVYVQSTIAGCSPSGLIAVTGSVTGSPIVANQLVSPNDTVCVNSPVTITLNPSGGNGAYTYSWSPITSSLSTVTETMVNSTSYNVIVTSGACSKLFNIPIVVVATPTANAGTSGTLTCVNTSTVLNGLGGGSYSWSGPGIVSGASSSSPTVNLPGTYVLTVTASGCSNTATVSVSQNIVQPLISVGTTGTVTCVSSTVSLTSNPSAMNYTWTAPAGSSITSGVNAQNASALGVGIYSVTIQDPVNGCSKTGTISANVDNTIPSVSVNDATLTCASTSTVLSGSIVAGATYTWTGAAITSGVNNSSVTVNAVGNYTIALTGTNGCSNTAVATVTNNISTATVSAGTNQTLVCGVTSVTLSGTATPSNSAANWLGGVATPNSYITSASAPGTYTLEVTHPISGCVSSSTVAVLSSTDVPQATVNAVTNSITCTNTVVSIGVTLSNSDPVDYLWSGPGISGSNNAATTTATIAGTYTVVITNTLTNCQASFYPVVPSNLTPVSASVAAPASITCSNPTVALSATPTGTNYSYSWSGVATVVSGSNTANPVVNTSGNYVVVITDNVNGCIGSYTVSVPINTTVATVTLTPNSVTTTCSSPTVALTATSSADPNSTYQWFSPSTGTLDNSSISNPIANGYGTFTVIVTSISNGCSSSVNQNTVEVFPDAATPSVSVTANSLSITCTNTSVTTAVTSTNTTLSYTWSPLPLIGGANPVFDTQGTYTANIAASNGCSVVTTVSVSLDNTAPTVSVSPTQTLTCLTTSVIVTTTVSPSGTYDYNWVGASIVGTTSLTSIDVNGIGDYTVSVLNTVNGCSVSAVSSVTIDTTPPTLSVSPTTTVLSCLTPTISLNASSGSSSSLVWATPTGTNSNPVLANISGDYIVSITDAINGCVNSQTVIISGNTVIPTSDAGVNSVIPCGATSMSLSGASTSTNSVNYSWSGPNPNSVLSGSNTTTPLISDVGTYTLTVTDPSNGCSSSSTVNVTQGNVTANFIASPTLGTAPLTVNFNDQSVGAINYNWIFGDGNTLLNVSPPSNPVNTYTTSGTYTVVLVVSSGVCTSTATAVIIVEDGLTIEIPNVFTPNGDGANEVFTIKSTGVKEMSLEIFNRWGEKLYSATGAKASWDGNTGQGAKVPDGTYFFMLKAKGFDDKEIEKQGYLNLYR